MCLSAQSFFTIVQMTRVLHLLTNSLFHIDEQSIFCHCDDMLFKWEVGYCSESFSEYTLLYDLVDINNLLCSWKPKHDKNLDNNIKQQARVCACASGPHNTLSLSHALPEGCRGVSARVPRAGRVLRVLVRRRPDSVTRWLDCFLKI